MVQDRNDTRAEVAGLSQQLSDFYNGDSWVTDNLHNRIFPLHSSTAFKKLHQHHHCIAEQMLHMNSWRNFALQKLTGNNSFAINDSSEDWPKENNWEKIKNDFTQTHHQLLKAIACFDITRWDAPVPGRTYTYLFLIKGIVHHDYYHYGQMTSLLSVLKET